MNVAWGGAAEPAPDVPGRRLRAGLAGLILLPVADDLRSGRDARAGVVDAGRASARAGLELAELLGAVGDLPAPAGGPTTAPELADRARAAWVAESLFLLDQGHHVGRTAELPGPGHLRGTLRDLYRAAAARSGGVEPEPHSLVRVTARWPREGRRTPLQRASEDARLAALVGQVVLAGTEAAAIAAGEDVTLLCLVPGRQEPSALVRAVHGVLARDLPGDWGYHVQAEVLPPTLGEALSVLSRGSVVTGRPAPVRRHPRPVGVAVPAQRRPGAWS